MSNSYDRVQRLADLVAHAGVLPQQKRFDLTGYKIRANPEPFDHIAYCAQALLSGALPAAETLMYVAVSLGEYVEAHGDLSLDDAFGLKAKPKAGNPSKQRFTRNRRLSQLFDMACMRADDPSITVADAAHRILKDDGQLRGYEALVRDYGRYRFREWESRIPKLPTRK